MFEMNSKCDFDFDVDYFTWLKDPKPQQERHEKFSSSEQQKGEGGRRKWKDMVLNDVKLQWYISVRVDIPLYRDYETMCLFHNHWSTTYDDLKLLRRKGGFDSESLPRSNFLTFGGHWNRKIRSCDNPDCFFEDGHSYVD
ncbi:uncharacterized protein LOC124438044 [Xenia sp. Carnegie-2017]|uniref:uncharacterized protein LOC124438044 n=1 Tax=Xenia sp. Carnegie-2017 TaxID=2897299 RepID=UPI001F033FB0|nr:uncharacterized protein LOC124438044 [Xenia sp. Carnegie-2017]